MIITAGCDPMSKHKGGFIPNRKDRVLTPFPSTHGLGGALTAGIPVTVDAEPLRHADRRKGYAAARERFRACFAIARRRRYISGEIMRSMD